MIAAGAERGHRERGVTLVELLMAMSISAIVVGAMGMALALAFRMTGETADRFTESHDAELIASYFVPDSQSSSTVGQTIETGCSQQGAADVIRLQGADLAVGYRLEGEILTRWTCTGSVSSARVVGRHVAAVLPWSEGNHQVALTVVAGSGHSYTIAGTQRTGTVDLPPAPIAVGP